MRESPRRLVGISAHICVRSSSGCGKRGRVYSRAVFERGVVVVLARVGKHLRRPRSFIWLGGSKVNISLSNGLNVAAHDAVRIGVRLVDAGPAGNSGRVGWSHGPAE